MNFLEFISDHFVSLQLEHAFNGFILNKIPLVKKLKLREFITLKLLYGGIRDENMPNNNNNVLNFPNDNYGVASSYTLHQEPYMEGSVGIGNIFKFFRVDIVRRFNYLQLPNVSEWGIRARFKFDF